MTSELYRLGLASQYAGAHIARPNERERAGPVSEP
jgi:hypothetical protein